MAYARPAHKPSPLPPAITATLGKLIPRLGSDHEGEVIATVRAIRRVLKSEQRDLHDLATAIVVPLQRPADEDWKAMARAIAEHQDRLSSRELDFLIDLARWRGALTPKQSLWLRAIYDRLT